MSNIKHHKKGTRIYNIWIRMKVRCYNKNYDRYKDHGGRGIRICDEWKDDFTAFYNWAMNNSYRDDLSIDRIDNDGNYEPSNCRWVDRKTQCNNRRTNIFLTYNDKTQTIAQWCNELQIKESTVYTRHKRGFTDKECLFGRKRIYKK